VTECHIRTPKVTGVSTDARIGLNGLVADVLKPSYERFYWETWRTLGQDKTGSSGGCTVLAIAPSMNPF
jgi:hypothetical protein